jgi:hypothetical protein
MQNILKEKALQQKAKGLGSHGSPDYSIDSTFTSTFYFPHKAIKTNPIKKNIPKPYLLSIRKTW